MKLVSLALRNLFRNTRRTLITIAAIATGLALMLFTIALQTGTYHDILSKGVSSLAGHVVVQHPDYQAEREEELVVRGASSVGAQLTELYPEGTVAPRLFLGGLLMSPTSSVGVALSAVDPEPEARVGYLDDKLVQGEWLDDDRGIVIGIGLADRLGVDLGDKVVYMGSQGSGDSNSRLFRVRGIFRTGSPEADGFIGVVHLAAAQELMEQPDIAHQVTLHLPDATESAAATARVREVVSTELAVLDWPEAVPELVGFIAIDRAGGDLMLTILGLIVAMGVLNTVLMSVLERTREFGVLLAIGLKPAQLASVVLLEGVFIGVLGAAAGLFFGVLLVQPFVVYGIDLAAFMGGTEAMDMAGVPVDTLVYGKWNIPRVSAYLVGAVAFTGLAALYPAIVVSRLQPVEAMRHV